MYLNEGDLKICYDTVTIFYQKNCQIIYMYQGIAVIKQFVNCKA